MDEGQEGCDSHDRRSYLSIWFTLTASIGWGQIGGGVAAGQRPVLKSCGDPPLWFLTQFWATSGAAFDGGLDRKLPRRPV